MTSMSNIKQAEEPFDGHPSSDTILRTSDGIDFHIHRIILILGSDFFRDMFSLPQPESMSGIKPVIEISESSKTLDTLLRLCYPIDNFPHQGLTSLLREVLEAAFKYQLTLAATIMKSRLRTYITTEPLHVYETSCSLMLEEDARSAVCQWKSVCPQKDENVVVDGKVMEWEKTIAGSSYITGMADISAGAYYRLLQFVRGNGKESVKFCIAESSVLPEAGSSNDLRVGTTVEMNNTIPLPDASPVHPAVSEKFNFTDYDLTVTSSDGMEFRVHEIILRLASPKLVKNIFINDHGYKYLSLPEDSDTLTKLFEICYPVDSIAVPDVAIAFHLFSVARKYELKKAIVFLVERLQMLMRSNPLSAYLTLAGSGFLNNATYVAQNALFQIPIEDLYVPEMEIIPAELYYHLLEYRHQCLTAVVDVCKKYEGNSQSAFDNPKWLTQKGYTSVLKTPPLSIPVVEEKLLALQGEARDFYQKYYVSVSGIQAPVDIVQKAGRFNLDELLQDSETLEQKISNKLSEIEIKSSCSSVHQVSGAAFSSQISSNA